MRRMTAFTACVSLLLVSGPSRADFTVKTVAGPITLSPQPSEPAVPRPPTRVPAFRTAVGFGTDVPLEFAVKQIVPSGITARFGQGVDRSAPVDWTGGRPWNRVLATAIQPLGLRMTTGATAVTITK